MKTCVILQPSYIPWRGVFDLIHRADVFVFYDDVQYDKHGWRNRNRVKTAQGSKWITIPVLSRGNVSEGLLLKDAKIGWNEDWTKKHASTIRQSYAKAPFFKEYVPLLDAFYTKKPELLCDFTIETTIELAKALGLDQTRFVRSSELGITGAKTERLVEIVKGVGCDHYLSGPSAKDYIDDAAFQNANVALEYIEYRYREYDQLHPPYDPQVTIFDLLFMKGADAPSFIWGEAKPAR